MNRNEVNQRDSFRVAGDQVFVLLPKKEWDEMSQIQRRILELLQDGKPSNLPGIEDYISKEEAMRITGKKETTLWKLRKDGKIKAAKMGQEVFYSRKSIVEYLNKNLR